MDSDYKITQSYSNEQTSKYSSFDENAVRPSQDKINYLNMQDRNKNSCMKEQAARNLQIKLKIGDFS